MIFSRRLVKKSIFYLILIFLIIKLIFNRFSIDSNESGEEITQGWRVGNNFVFKSRCECKKNIILRQNLNEDGFTVERSALKSYNITINEFNSLKLSCNYYNFFARSSGIKVISYSLYGKLDRYYKMLEKLAELINEYYPGWIIRIYHDSSIYKSFICKLECLPFNNVDFCDISQLPLIKNSTLFKYKQEMSYLHSMMWRWLPIGDSFVDLFISRDTDSLIIKREVDSVKVWLNSSKTAHIMRDHKWHKREILGTDLSIYILF